MSDDTDKSQKTEQPTPRRIEKAREEGQVPRSREVNNWLILTGATLIIAFISTYLAGQLGNELTPFIADVATILATPAELISRSRSLLGVIITAILVPCLLVTFLSILGNIAMHGLLFTPKLLAPKPERLSPLRGLKRTFSLENLVEFGKGIIKISIVAAVGIAVIIPDINRVDTFITTPPNQAPELLISILIKMMLAMLAVYLLITALDVGFQFYNHRRRLRMSHKEIRDELKQTEGDPQIKARIRKIRLERHRQRLVAAMERADVVITNPEHFAVVLEYKPETMATPVLVAKGKDHRAQTIRRLAEKYDIPIVSDPPVARAIFATTEEEQEITPEHYQAVAIIIGRIYRLKNRNLPN